MGVFDPVLTKDTVILKAIKDLCISRNYRCRGCKYSAIKLTDLTNIQTCIFANCPCDWKIEEPE